MRFKAKLAGLSFVVIAIITLYELVYNEDKPDVWEKIKKKNDDSGGMVVLDSETSSFESYCARFGKSYKNAENYNKRKKEYLKTLMTI